MTSPDTVDVAIIGGGAAGTLTAVHLLRTGRPVRVAIVERTDRLGRGIPYSTTNPRHLMNVPASGMGGLAGRPGHLVEWCAAQGEPVEGAAFVSRPLFGRYLVALLRDAIAGAAVAPLAVRDDAVAVSRSGGRLRVALAGGARSTPAGSCSPPGRPRRRTFRFPPARGRATRPAVRPTPGRRARSRRWPATTSCSSAPA